MPDAPVTVRLATAADVDAAERLIRSAIVYDPRWHRDVDDLPGSYLETAGQALFVAVVHGTDEVVGAAVIRHRQPTPESVARRFTPRVSCELGRVTVAPEWRRRGVALQLTEASRVWARHTGYESLHLHADGGNTPALALWRSVANEIPRDDVGDSVYFEIPITLPVRPRSRPAPGGYRARLATSDDLDAARALMVRVLEEDYGYGYRPDVHADMDDLHAHYLAHPRQALAVAVDQSSGQVIALGCIQIGGRFPQPRPDDLPARYPREITAEMTRVFAAREHRRRGAARDVVEVLRRWARSYGGYQHVVLHTNTSRDGAEAFWSSIAIPLYDSRPSKFNTVHFELPLHRTVSGSHPERIDFPEGAES